LDSDLKRQIMRLIETDPDVRAAVLRTLEQDLLGFFRLMQTAHRRWGPLD
jgi:hypothetical protein